MTGRKQSTDNGSGEDSVFKANEFFAMTILRKLKFNHGVVFLLIVAACLSLTSCVPSYLLLSDDSKIKKGPVSLPKVPVRGSSRVQWEEYYFKCEVRCNNQVDDVAYDYDALQDYFKLWGAEPEISKNELVHKTSPFLTFLRWNVFPGTLSLLLDGFPPLGIPGFEDSVQYDFNLFLARRLRLLPEDVGSLKGKDFTLPFLGEAHRAAGTSAKEVDRLYHVSFPNTNWFTAGEVVAIGDRKYHRDLLPSYYAASGMPQCSSKHILGGYIEDTGMTVACLSSIPFIMALFYYTAEGGTGRGNGAAGIGAIMLGAGWVISKSANSFLICGAADDFNNRLTKGPW